MKTKIEIERTYWIGVTADQLKDLRRILDYVTANDLDSLSKRVTVGSADFLAQVETFEALKEAVGSVKDEKDT